MRSAARAVAICAILLVAIVWLFQVLVYDWYSVPAGSMKEAIGPGDILVVNKMAYGYSRHSCPGSLCSFNGRVFGSAPERGDIVVFGRQGDGFPLVKRIVGLPGERIRMCDGVLHIDGKPVPTEAAGYFEEAYERQGRSRRLPLCENRPAAIGATCRKRRYVETLPGGAAHSILDIHDSAGDNTPGIVVPVGEYFLLGDHRDNSLDSRYPRASGGGTVPADDLIGRVDIVF